MEYYESLRTVVGNQPIILVGAMVAIFDEHNRVLMQRDRKKEYWTIPGGLLDMGERIEETARREVKEECGIDITHLNLAGVFSGPDYFETYPNGDQAYSVTILYMTDHYEGKLRPDSVETDDIGFFSLNDLPTPINPMVAKTAQTYLKTGKVQ